MKKDRNTFFQSAGMSSQTVMPNMGMQQPMMQQPMMQQPMMQPGMQQGTMNMMNPQMPVQASQASQSFYSGPYPHGMDTGMQTTDIYELSRRMDELEKYVTRLEARISRLENQPSSTTNTDYSSKMYMV